MPLTKSKGNMYPWVTHTHSHLGGACPHQCSYCYVSGFPWRLRIDRYTGPLRLIEKEFAVKYGSGKTIFIEHCNDLLAKEVPNEFIDRIIHHCKEYPDNTYVFQSKNPVRFQDWAFPRDSIFGTTIETNRMYPETGKAPSPAARYVAMRRIPGRKFVTVEPVMDFDVAILAYWISDINPEFLNLGADSKGHGLPEPSVEKIMELVAELKKYGIELREKHNLQRLRKQ